MWTKIERVNPVDVAVTLDDAKEHLRVDHPDEDNLIDIYDRAATEAIENEAGISLTSQEFDVFMDCFPVRPAEIRLGLGPIISVDTVKYTSTTQQTWSSAEYEVDTKAGLIRPAEGFSWPDTDEVYNAVEIRVTAGWTDAALPHALRAAVFLTIEHLYRNRNNVVEVQAGIQELPRGVTALIDPYRRGRFGA